MGTAGTHLQSLININQPTPGLSETPVTQRRPYPLFQNIMEVADVETSRYHALQLTAEQRLTRGLSFNASYTFSHALDYCSGNAVPATIPIMNTYNRRLDYGNADFDIRHRLLARFDAPCGQMSRPRTLRVVRNTPAMARRSMRTLSSSRSR